LGAESETIIIAADRAGRVDALTTDGRQEWSEDVGGPITSVPTIVGNTVVVATTSGELVALDGPGGTELWRYPSEEDDQPITSLEFGAALADGILYAAGSDAVVAVDAASGSYVCHSRTPDRATAPSTIANGHVYTPVGASVHVMQIGTCQLRADGGQVALQMGVQTVTSPAVLDDVMYIGSGLLIAAFDTFSGEEAFPSSSVFTGAQVLGSPIIAGDVVYAGSSDQFVYAVDRTSWDELWKYDTGGIVAAPVAVVDDAVFVLNRSGKLIALGPASSE
jgi:outer membrane protein assembly factor BamB